VRAPHPLGCRLRSIDAKGWAAAADQHALQLIGDVGYHNYEGTGRNPAERARLLADLGDRHILVLRNHGLLIVGTSIAAAFVATYRMERACAMQLAFQQSGAAFHPITEEVVTAAYSPRHCRP
jgi:ribulose-5-phosphate 4-epimerase/fuculose-1-phosphate aldolase